MDRPLAEASETPGPRLSNTFSFHHSWMLASSYSKFPITTFSIMNLIEPISNGSQTPSSEISYFESSVDIEIDPFTQLTKDRPREVFTTNRSLKKSLGFLHQALLKNQTQDQYLIITSVPTDQFAKLSDDRSSVCKYCRFTFNTETGIFVAKVIPSPAHELAIRSFDILISLELRSMNIYSEMRPLGSSTITVGAWKKEPDCSWAPASASTNPTFVVEIGLSETQRQLALDAHGWLETSSCVKLVVTISIKRETPEIILRRWELMPWTYGITTKSSSPAARCTEILSLSRTNNTTLVTGKSYMNNTTTTTTQLTLPFNKIINRAPYNSLERDLIIQEHELISFAESIWSEQRLL